MEKSPIKRLKPFKLKTKSQKFRKIFKSQKLTIIDNGRKGTDKTIILEDTDEIFYELSDKSSWIDTIKLTVSSEYVLNFFRSCKRRLRGRQNKPYTVKDLPCTEFIKSCSLSIARVVRFQNPWDFHLVFKDNLLKGWRDGSKDLAHFLVSETRVKHLSQDFFRFHSPFRLYRGFAVLLSLFVKLWKSYNFKQTLDRIPYQAGDLVVVIVRRYQAEKKTKRVAYRALVLERVAAITKNLKLLRRFAVYLLDTGERKIVPRKSLHPLPRPFIRCPPLAVKCALHGISPVGPEWSLSAGRRMETLINPENEVKLFAEFFSEKEAPVSKKSSVSDFLDCFANTEPYFVELRTVMGNPEDENKPCVQNVSTLLCSLHLGLEWSLFPSRSLIRQGGEGKIEAKRDRELLNAEKQRIDFKIKREDALLLCETNPYQINIISEQQRNLDLNRLFTLRPDLKTRILTGVENVVAVRVEDDNGILRNKCVPSSLLSPEET